MELKKLFTEDRAVSPVIAVVLMIAVTVILAAVVAAFALGLGGSGASAPQANFDSDYTQGTPDLLEMTHEGGDSISEDRLTVVISGATGTGTPNAEWLLTDLGIADGATVDTGTTITISDANVNGNNGDLDLSAATARVVWTSESGDRSATIAEWSGPDA